ncbi:protein Mpe1p [Trichomonascus vanleenenianus]|uniref:protein Mpe1p n=1 Tax=Trichomonascus vanleenenianus TaxID=2268995 RepID=UPI003EC99711
MSSVVYYKFKSQKEPSRITFDGTGISVFDLKKEILIANKLTATADSFDLHIINPDTKEEYADDSQVIPRSMSVIARRLPANKPGASKYVTGTLASIRQKKQPAPVIKSSAPSNAGLPDAPAGSEEEKISAMFQAQGEQWQQTQQHMASAAPVYYSSHSKINANVPDHPPPAGYVCYRCGQKGHWIQACPTNNDPNWEGKRVRRTTGIPRSMLKTVAKPANEEDSPSTMMINDEGEYVVAVADNASWQNYQKKAKEQGSKAANSKPTDPELQDPITHKLFVDPVTTPCCKKTYSRDALETVLLDSDFKCPNCGQDEVLLDQLTPDKEMQKRVEEYKKGLNGGDNKESDESSKRKREEDEQEGEDADGKKAKTDEANGNGEENTPNDQQNFMQMPMMPPPMMMMMSGMMPPFMPMMDPNMMMNFQKQQQQQQKPDQDQSEAQKQKPQEQAQKRNGGSRMQNDSKKP